MKHRKSVFSFKLLVNSLRKTAKLFSALRRESPLPTTNYQLKTKQGFALLITLVVVSVVLAIGLSLLFVTTKQFLLAVTANESEKAFQAAQIGLECMRYHRAQSATKTDLLNGGNAPALVCGGASPGFSEASTLYNNSGRLLYRYRYQYTINGSQCVEPSLYIANLQGATANLTYALSGEGLGTIECTAGTVCTVIFARGYNRPCSQLNNSIFTLQREITVEY